MRLYFSAGGVINVVRITVIMPAEHLCLRPSKSGRKSADERRLSLDSRAGSRDLPIGVRSEGVV